MDLRHPGRDTGWIVMDEIVVVIVDGMSVCTATVAGVAVKERRDED